MYFNTDIHTYIHTHIHTQLYRIHVYIRDPLAGRDMALASCLTLGFISSTAGVARAALVGAGDKEIIV